jgi:hypothetical protein
MTDTLPTMSGAEGMTRVLYAKGYPIFDYPHPENWETRGSPTTKWFGGSTISTAQM